MMKFYVLVSILVFATVIEGKRSKQPLLTEGCPPCDRKACQKVPRSSCPSGALTKDACGCCKSCASGMGDRCGGYEWADGICAKGLLCARYTQTFHARIEFGEVGSCICLNQDTVCGTDGQLYDDACTLRKANVERIRRGESKVTETKLRTCGGAPKIITGPEDMTVSEGGQFYLECEAEGIPIPDIRWTRNNKKLPGDENNVSIQIRGGPMKNCLSSWVMVNRASMKDGGEYICYAENNEGMRNATVYVVVTL